MKPPHQDTTPMDLTPAEAAIADRYAQQWGCTRDQAVTRMVSEQMRHRYVKPRGPSARVVPIPRR